jgi:hypothetical protein
MKNLKTLEVWFVTGSQHLYGPETLRQVSTNAEKIAAALGNESSIPVSVVFKPIVTTPDPFDRLCFVHGIEHRLTKPNHPWTNGQVERMNRTIKDATVKRYFYDTHNQLKAHLTDFLRAYNFARRLKTLKGLTPYEYLCKLWTQTPGTFTLNPIHQMPGLNN